MKFIKSFGKVMKFDFVLCRPNEIIDVVLFHGFHCGMKPRITSLSYAILCTCRLCRVMEISLLRVLEKSWNDFEMSMKMGGNPELGGLVQ